MFPAVLSIADQMLGLVINMSEEVNLSSSTDCDLTQLLGDSGLTSVVLTAQRLAG